MSIHAILEALTSAAAIVDQILGNHVAMETIGVDEDHSIGPIVTALSTYVHPAKPRAYVCHPVSAFRPDGTYDPVGMQANLANARAWLRWLVDNTTWAVSMPWMPYVEELDEETYRERGIADDLALIDGHSLLVLVSDRVSSGMKHERSYAMGQMIPIIDLTSFGCFAPPKPGTDTFDLLRKVLGAIVPGTLRELPAAA